MTGYPVIGAMLIASLALSGCAFSPLTEYSLDVPAQSLRPIDAEPAIDGRSRFRELFCTILHEEGRLTAGAEQCSQLLHHLNDEPDRWTAAGPLPEHNPSLRIIVVPGLFNECVSDFVNVYEHAAGRLREKGYQVDWLNVGGRSSSRQNAQQIADHLRESPVGERQPVLFIGHSKGTVDILRFLVDYPEMANQVAAVASVSGAVNGSPLADWSAARLKSWGGLIPERLCSLGDNEALDTLRGPKRLAWLAANPLPDSVAYYSLVGFTQRDRVTWPLLASYDLLSFIDPRNDGQLLFSDQVIPGATLLGYANADHWSIALPVTTKLPWLGFSAGAGLDFPRDALLEAIVLFVAERLADDDRTD